MWKSFYGHENTIAVVLLPFLITLWLVMTIGLCILYI